MSLNNTTVGFFRFQIFVMSFLLLGWRFLWFLLSLLPDRLLHRFANRAIQRHFLSRRKFNILKFKIIQFSIFQRYWSWLGEFDRVLFSFLLFHLIHWRGWLILVPPKWYTIFLPMCYQLALPIHSRRSITGSHYGGGSWV